MSDSSIRLKPVIDEPSKPIPSLSAPSISLGVIANDFRCPSRSVNQNRTCSTPSSLIRFSTARRAATLDVARSLLCTCAARLVAGAALLLGLAIFTLLRSPAGQPSPPRATAPRGVDAIAVRLWSPVGGLTPGRRRRYN